MDQGAVGAVAGNNIDTVVTAFEGRLPVIQSEAAFRPFGSVAAKTNRFKDRTNITVIIHGNLRRSWKLARVDFGGLRRKSVKGGSNQENDREEAGKARFTVDGFPGSGGGV